MMSIEQSAIDFLKNSNEGILSTLFEGIPYGSLTPFALTKSGPLIYISHLARHTKNLEVDKNCALTIYSTGAENPQASTRICLMAKAVVTEDKDDLEAYFTKFPGSKDFTKAHGFKLMRLEISRSHFIQGFGKINWIEGNFLENLNNL